MRAQRSNPSRFMAVLAALHLAAAFTPVAAQASTIGKAFACAVKASGGALNKRHEVIAANRRELMSEEHYKNYLRVAHEAGPVVESLLNDGKLPANYITKEEARSLGWADDMPLVWRSGDPNGPKKPPIVGKRLPDGRVVGADAQLGGSRYEDNNLRLPAHAGREWFEVDIAVDTAKKRVHHQQSAGVRHETRGAYRVVYSSDGLIYGTTDHYDIFHFLGCYSANCPPHPDLIAGGAAKGPNRAPVKPENAMGVVGKSPKKAKNATPAVADGVDLAPADPRAPAVLDAAKPVVKAPPKSNSLGVRARARLYRALGGVLSVGEFEALAAYTSDGFKSGDGLFSYEHINGKLRSKRPLTQGEIDFVSRVNGALRKLKNYEGTVHRMAEDLPLNVTRKLKVGETFADEGFLSTSKYKLGTALLAEGLYEFKIKSTSGRSLGFLANPRPEFEVLFEPGTRFKVTAVKTKGYKTIVEMEEVAETTVLREARARGGTTVDKILPWLTTGSIVFGVAAAPETTTGN